MFIIDMGISHQDNIRDLIVLSVLLIGLCKPSTCRSTHAPGSSVCDLPREQRQSIGGACNFNNDLCGYTVSDTLWQRHTEPFGDTIFGIVGDDNANGLQQTFALFLTSDAVTETKQSTISTPPIVYNGDICFKFWMLMPNQNSMLDINLTSLVDNSTRVIYSVAYSPISPWRKVELPIHSNGLVKVSFSSEKENNYGYVGIDAVEFYTKIPTTTQVLSTSTTKSTTYRPTKMLRTTNAFKTETTDDVIHVASTETTEVETIKSVTASTETTEVETTQHAIAPTETAEVETSEPSRTPTETAEVETTQPVIAPTETTQVETTEPVVSPTETTEVETTEPVITSNTFTEVETTKSETTAAQARYFETTAPGLTTQEITTEMIAELYTYERTDEDSSTEVPDITTTDELATTESVTSEALLTQRNTTTPPDLSTVYELPTSKEQQTTRDLPVSETVMTSPTLVRLDSLTTVEDKPTTETQTTQGQSTTQFATTDDWETTESDIGTTKACICTCPTVEAKCITTSSTLPTPTKDTSTCGLPPDRIQTQDKYSCNFDQSMCDFSLDFYPHLWEMNVHRYGDSKVGVILGDHSKDYTGGYLVFNTYNNHVTANMKHAFTSPRLQPNTSYCLSFWYNMPNNHSLLNVVMVPADGSANHILWSSFYQQTDGWVQASLSVYGKTAFMLQFLSKKERKESFLGVDDIQVGTEMHRTVRSNAVIFHNDISKSVLEDGLMSDDDIKCNCFCPDIIDDCDTSTISPIMKPICGDLTHAVLVNTLSCDFNNRDACDYNIPFYPHLWELKSYHYGNDSIGSINGDDSTDGDGVYVLFNTNNHHVETGYTESVTSKQFDGAGELCLKFSFNMPTWYSALNVYQNIGGQHNLLWDRSNSTTTGWQEQSLLLQGNQTFQIVFSSKKNGLHSYVGIDNIEVFSHLDQNE